MKFNKKIELLTEHFKERFITADRIRSEMSRELGVLQANRKQIADSIEKYAGDEFVIKILQAQKEYFDLNFDKNYQSIKLEIEDFEKQFPLMERFIELTKAKVYDKETLETYIDLFTSQLLRDILEKKSLDKKEEV